MELEDFMIAVLLILPSLLKFYTIHSVCKHPELSNEKVDALTNMVK